MNEQIKTKEDLINLIKQKYIDNHKKVMKKNLKNFKILLLNAPCNGFGDIIFCIKLANYIKKFYGIQVKIASTQSKMFLQLGEKSENLLELKTKTKNVQCKKFSQTTLHHTGKSSEIYDLILVAPLQMDFKPDIKDVKSIIPYADQFNTLFFSEYNDDLDKNFDFNMGVGDIRDGIFVESISKDKTRIKELKNNYFVIYIADIKGSDGCMLNYIEMILEKYHKKYNKFDLVIVPWIERLINKTSKYSIKQRILSIIKKYYDTIVLKTKDSETVLYHYDEKTGKKYKDIDFIEFYEKTDIKKLNNIFTIRADILPLQYSRMLSLYKYAEREILVTGDQSISDVLSCCWKDKLPFYQIVPWKKDFLKNLYEQLPQKFFEKVRTSCGSIEAVKYNPNFEKFMRKWNFKDLGKKKLDSLINMNIDIKNTVEMSQIRDLVCSKHKLSTILKQIDLE